MTSKEDNSEVFINEKEIIDSDIEKAKKALILLYSSDVWKAYEEDGIPITLSGCVHLITQILKANSAQTLMAFQLANHFGWVKIYTDLDKGLCLKKGDNYLEIIRQENNFKRSNRINDA